VLAGTDGSGETSLAWSRPSRGSQVRRYRIYRNGQLMATVRGRHFSDTGSRAGGRYRVVGVDALGRVRARSRAVVVRAAARAARAGGRLIRASLAAERRGLWRSAYVERRVSVRGRLRWVRASRVRRARSSVAFRVSGNARGAVRIVVRSSWRARRVLHSAAFQLGRA
jgi:hypothetical protein